MIPVTHEILAYRVAAYRFWRLTPEGPLDVIGPWKEEPSDSWPGYPLLPAPVRDADAAKLAQHLAQLESALPAFLPGDTRGAEVIAAIRSGDREAVGTLLARCNSGYHALDQVHDCLRSQIFHRIEEDEFERQTMKLVRSLRVVQAAMQTAVDAARAYLVHDYASGSSRLDVAMEGTGATLAEHRDRAERAIAAFRSNPRNLRPH